MSAGQIIGAGIGAIAGFFTGGATWYAVAASVAQGAALGYGIGGLIDPPKMPDIQGPRLEDTSVQLASYGANIPRLYGTLAMHGTMFWIENDKLKEVATTKKVGGKGGKKQKQTTYKYYLTCAIAFAVGKVPNVRRIWLSDKLWYDGGMVSQEAPNLPNQSFITNTRQVLAAVLGSAKSNGSFTWHDGDPNQMPDSRMSATLGASRTPAFRDIAYLVLTDIDMTDFGNSPMGLQVKVELAESGTPVPVGLFAKVETGVGFFQNQPPPGNYIGPNSYGPYFTRASGGVISSGITMNLAGTPTTYSWASTLDGIPFNGSITDEFGGRRTYGQIGYFGGYWATYEKVFLQGAREWAHGYFQCGSINIPRDTVSQTGFGGACISSDGEWLAVFMIGTGGTQTLRLYDTSLTLVSEQPHTMCTLSARNIDYPSIQGGTAYSFALENGRKRMWVGIVYGGWMSCHYVNGDGTTSYEYSWTENYYGPYSNSMAIWAYDGICYGAHNGGGTFAFSMAPKVLYATVPLSDIVRRECLLCDQLTLSDLDVSSLTDTVRGYKVTGTAAIRGSIETLRSAYPFDVIQDGYKIKFVRRGKSPVATIEESDLGVMSGESATADKLTISREMASQLPNRISITYYDYYREYDANEQYAERISGDTSQFKSQDLPIALTATEAAGMCEVLLYLNWMERHDLSWTLNASWWRLQPTDVVTINALGQSHQVRIVSITAQTDGTLVFSGKYNNAATYVPKAVGEEGGSIGPGIEIAGPSVAVLIDGPAIIPDFNYVGQAIASKGAYETWHGAVFEYSANTGTTWDVVGVTAPPSAMIGAAVTSLAAGKTTYMLDQSVKFRVNTFGHQLASVTLDQLLAGANHFLLGADGRWEVIGVMTCTLVSTDVYDLTGLLRGQYGTEWAVGTHQAGDHFIAIEGDAGKIFVGLLSSDIGAARYWRWTTAGEDESSGGAIHTYKGVNLECFAPVQFNVTQIKNGDWWMRGTRRTRLSGEWRDYVDVPVSETTESYDFEIYTDSTFTTIKRTINSATPSATYTNAMQVTDWGTSVRLLYAQMRQRSELTGGGYPATTTGYSQYSIAVMSFEEVTLTELYGKTVTVSGTGARSTVAKKFGTASGRGDGTNTNKINIAGIVLGTGDFTVEFDFMMTSFPSGGYATTIFQIGDVLDGDDGFLIASTSTGTIIFHDQYYNRNNWVASAVLNTWSSFAAVRKGDEVRLFLAGPGATNPTSYQPFTGFTRSFAAAKNAHISGGNRSYPAPAPTPVYTDNLRILGYAKYWDIGSFSAHTEQFTI